MALVNMPLIYLSEGVPIEKKTGQDATEAQVHLAGPSKRVALGRYPECGRYDMETVAAILDEALVCHVGFDIAGQPYVIPTTYGRIGYQLYIHGSPVARWLRALGEAIPICITVTLLDGLVLAR